MKILITTDLFTTQTNGVVTSVRNLRRELEARGHEVRILTLSNGSYSYRVNGVYYIRSAPLGVVYPDVRMATSFHHRLIRQLIAWKPDVIHSQCEFFTFQFARFISKHTGAPIVHTYHTLYEQYVGYVLPLHGMEGKAVAKMSRFRLKHVDRVIAPTRKVERTLRTYGLGMPISVLPSGIRLAQHKKRLPFALRQEKRLALGIPDGSKVLLNIGRLGDEKNLDELIRYYADARKKYENLYFLIVGDGPDRRRLEALSMELGVHDRVLFTGMVPPTQVQEYYQLGDIFVSASTSETQGLTYIEAAANGLPLLCRQDPCLEDVLISGENGYTYTEESGFAAALAAMLTDAAWLDAAGQRSEQIAAKYGTEVFGAMAEEIYLDVLREREESRV